LRDGLLDDATTGGILGDNQKIPIEPFDTTDAPLTYHVPMSRSH